MKIVREDRKRATGVSLEACSAQHQELKCVEPVWAVSELSTLVDCPDSAKVVFDWVQSYVIEANVQLGRDGPVCPFVPPALKNECVWLSVVNRATQTKAQLSRILREYLDIFGDLTVGSSRVSELATLVVVFPKLVEPNRARLIVAAHSATKPLAVRRGLMLGEFYPESDSPGLYNSCFFPLRSPIPLFVFRRMVPGDLVFLNKPSDPPGRRYEYISAYLSSLKGKLASTLRVEAFNALEEARRAMKESAQKRINIHSCAMKPPVETHGGRETTLPDPSRDIPLRRSPSES